jgi:hypothetical protein
MSRCTIITFQISIVSKLLAKHISTKVSYTIAIRNRHVYIDIRLRWIWTNISGWDIWNDNSTKMIVLLLFQLFTLLNSQITYEIEFLTDLWHINFNKNIGISNWLIWSIATTKMKFLTPFHFDTRLLTSSTWNPLVHASWSEMERCEKRAFQPLKMRKKNISLNIKTKYVTDG